MFKHHLEGARSTASLALRNVLRQRRRSAIAVAAVALGVVSMLLAAGFIEWLFWGMREGTIRSRLGHIQIVRQGYLEAGAADPFAYLLPAASPAGLDVERRAGVRTVSPRIAFTRLASFGDATLSFLGEGMDPEREAEINTSVVMVAGENLSSDEPRGVILGWGLAANLGVKPGDTVVLLATTASGGLNGAEVRVRGVFSTVTKAYDDAALRAPIALARELLRVEGAHAWIVLLDKTESTTGMVRALRPELAARGLDAIPWYELADFYNKTVALFSTQVGVLRLIVAIIIVLSIANVMTMSVMERTGEIGTALALGVSRARVLAQVVLEGLVLGAAGGGAGLLVGAALAKIISAVGIPMPPPPGMARGFSGEILVTAGIAFDALVLAVVTALGASVYPAWKASRMVIVDALRHNR
jgi:putative ABC transport system permease protein